MPSDLDIAASDRRKKSSVDVRGQHLPVRADAIRKPARDGAKTAADLETLPAIGHAAGEQMTNGALRRARLPAPPGARVPAARHCGIRTSSPFRGRGGCEADDAGDLVDLTALLLDGLGKLRWHLQAPP